MELLSAAETARILRLNVKRVQALARAGRLPATRVGRKWLFPRNRIDALLGQAPEEAVIRGVELSARNQLRGTVHRIDGDGVLCEVVVDIGGQELVAIITRASVERLRLAVGAPVVAVIKSTEVMIGRDL
ncbi:MAG: TOBE domain-containing protein [Gemmatimonadetes bacterium]|nr:TOBE domain-containing protein [Gemmatimonadota bacterium]